jgi:hypothetical protein
VQTSLTRPIGPSQGEKVKTRGEGGEALRPPLLAPTGAEVVESFAAGEVVEPC